MWVWLLSLVSKFGLTAAEVFGGPVVTLMIASLLKYWKYYVLGLSVLLNFGLAYEWRHTNASLVTEKASHQTDINTFKTAQAAADKKANDERAALTKEGKAKADVADKEYSSLLAQYHSSLVRYKQTNPGGGSQPGDSQFQPTQGTDGPSSSTDLPPTLIISGSDAQMCAVNTARLQAAHDWALSLPKGTDAQAQ